MFILEHIILSNCVLLYKCGIIIDFILYPAKKKIDSNKPRKANNYAHYCTFMTDHAKCALLGGELFYVSTR